MKNVIERTSLRKKNREDILRELAASRAEYDRGQYKNARVATGELRAELEIL